MTVDDLWTGHDLAWREPGQIVSQWSGADGIDPRLIRARARGAWWETLASLGVTLLVTREYEHLVVALGSLDGRPRVTFLPMPHPSGLVVDRGRGIAFVASTRNPNQVHRLEAVATGTSSPGPLIPVVTDTYRGGLYLHDLALIDGRLHGNAVAENAVVRLCGGGRYERVWWPRCVEADDGPRFDRNYLQLNSIASGNSVVGSFFTASSDRIGRRRPGHLDFPVDRQGVLFSGLTREAMVRGLTRPHSARLHEGRVWLDNSGYGEFGVVDGDRFQPIIRLPGWTRGLAFVGGIAFVGTSRILPRFHRYAPGLDPTTSVCGIHAVELASGRVLGSLDWSLGNQIFAIDWLGADAASGLPFAAGRRSREAERRLFYAFRVGAG